MNTPNALRQIPEDLRLKAQAAARKLGQATEQNARILKGAMQAIERLSRTIITLVKEEALPQGGYGNIIHGGAAQAYSPICQPVTGTRIA